MRGARDSCVCVSKIQVQVKTLWQYEEAEPLERDEGLSSSENVAFHRPVSCKGEQKAGHYQPGCRCASILILNLPGSPMVRNKFLLFIICSLVYFVIAAKQIRTSIRLITLLFLPCQAALCEEMWFYPQVRPLPPERNSWDKLPRQETWRNDRHIFGTISCTPRFQRILRAWPVLPTRKLKVHPACRDLE